VFFSKFNFYRLLENCARRIENKRFVKIIITFNFISEKKLKFYRIDVCVKKENYIRVNISI